MPFSKRAVGQPIDRVDGREKVLGRALFAADHRISDLASAFEHNGFKVDLAKHAIVRALTLTAN